MDSDEYKKMQDEFHKPERYEVTISIKDGAGKKTKKKYEVWAEDSVYVNAEISAHKELSFWYLDLGNEKAHIECKGIKYWHSSLGSGSDPMDLVEIK